MKRIVLIGLAVVCALAAVLVALVGLSSGDKDASKKPAPARYSVVVANADFPPGHYLRPEDLRVAKLATLPVDAFATTAGLSGKQLAQPAVAGQPLTRSQLAASHPLAGQLRPGERAVALQTTKIVGVGGYLKPGDWVDVLVYFRAQEETANATSAMLALSRLRVLSYENELPPEPEAVVPAGEEATAKDDKADADKPARLAEERKSRSDKNPSVVLAVPADQAVRLLLAAEAGEVRLALRPPEPAVDAALAGAPVYTPAPANAREAQALKLTQLSFNKPVTAAGTARAPAAAPAAAKVKVVNRIEIFDGDKPRAAESSK